MSRRSTAVLMVVLGLVACDAREQIEEVFRDPTSHELYAASLRRAGLAENAVARTWATAAQGALERPLGVSLPFHEEGYLDPAEPRALGFELDAEHGQRIVVDVALDALDSGRVFVDLFRQPADSGAVPFHEADLSEGSSQLEYRVPRSGRFLVRVQPELLHGGRYALQIRVLPTLAFPVDGQGSNAIQSRFGASRDGGRRQHRGVDIFAPRGTPALAAAPGEVYRVDTTNLGGYVVWVRDDHTNDRLYYAHLDRQLVREGDRVEIGDTVGLVGNTGNARTTPPHLHFGLYRRRQGALDPWWFILPRDSVAPVVAEGGARPGEWLRASREGVLVRTAPSSRAGTVAELGADAPVRVMGRVAGWYRVQLPDRVEGYAPERSLTGLLRPIRVATLAAGTPVRALPRPDAPVLRSVDAPDQAVDVQGMYGDFGLVLGPDGAQGWVSFQDSQ